MKCEQAQERMTFALYGELPDDQTHQLEHHLRECADCQQEWQTSQAFLRAMAEYPVEDPHPNLVARARMRLEEALDTMPPLHWTHRLGQHLRNGFFGLRASPVAASFLLLLGLGAGSFGGYRFAAARANSLPATVDGEISDVAEVAAVDSHSGSEQVELHLNRLVPTTVKGSLDDPQIRHLLMVASQSSPNPGVRDDSVRLLAAECRAGHACNGGGMRDALMVALRYDKSPAVRRKALHGLEPYISQDTRVRDAVLEALLSDEDDAVREQSLQMLTPVEADSSVRQVLNTVAVQDGSPAIRTASRQFLSQMPEIQ